MNYVYILSFEDIPFYAGMTKDPIQRYKGHYFWGDCKTQNYMRYKLHEFNKFADMTLLAVYNNRDEACKYERFVIQSLMQAGFNILNKDHNYANILLYPPIYKNLPRLAKGTFTDNILNKIRIQIHNLSLCSN